VGDDDQCIYAWRGADIRNILDFEKDYPEAKVVKLEQNYRSKGNILEAANKVIKNNAERKFKILRTEQVEGEKISIHRAYSDKMEAAFVVSEIEKLKSDKGYKYKDFAVLYRTNAQSRNFEEALRRAGIPYRIFGGLKFYDRKEIKDILAYLKIIVNPKDSISLRRIINVPKRSIGDTTVEKLQNHATEIDDTLYNVLLDVDYVPGLTARSINPIKKFIDMMEEIMVMSEQLSVSQLIEYVLEKTGYLKSLKDSKLIEDQSRIENLEELVSDAVEFEKSNEEDKSLSAYLEKVALVQDMDDLEAEDNYGIFPNAACFEHDNQMEEARRLCYVGITRAEEKLYMTSAETRMIFGKTVAYGQSDFISEIPANIKDYVNINGKSSSNSFKNTSQTYGETRKTYNPHSIRGGMSVSKANESLNKTLSGKSSGNAGIDELTMG
ncbi:MAG: 3'-5' exonuclease, partial [Clostridium perfringens]|nr:3'-5' exonuclease [Clostridium perfringens]